MQELIDTVLHSSHFRVIVFGLVLLILWHLFQRGTKHVRLESQLPTSKVGSVTVGLAEIRGKTQAIKTCTSPWSKTECIAYSYEKQRTRLEDGILKRTVLAKRTEVMPFEIVDDTGQILIDINGLEMHQIPIKYTTDSSTDLTHKEVILKSGLEVLLIGRATPVNGKMVMFEDTTENVFDLTNYKDVEIARRLAPMYKILGIYTLVTLILVALIVSV